MALATNKRKKNEANIIRIATTTAEKEQTSASKFRCKKCDLCDTGNILYLASERILAVGLFFLLLFCAVAVLPARGLRHYTPLDDLFGLCEAAARVF